MRCLFMPNLLNVGTRGGWPSGRDGVLLVLSGETFTISSDKDYSSIQVDSGGTLELGAQVVLRTDETAAEMTAADQTAIKWISLGCKGDFTLNGTFNAVSGEYPGGQYLDNTFITNIAPD